MWNSILSSDASKSLTGALERAGEAITQGATNAAKQKKSTSVTVPDDSSESHPACSSSEASTQQQTSPVPGASSSQQTRQALFSSQRFQQGWGNMVEVTKQAVELTREAVEKEQSRILSGMGNNPQQCIRARDVSLPLDKEALRDAEVVYITDRIISMGHPALQSPYDGDITPHRKLSAVQHLLEKRHANKYMIWNLSEVEYDAALLHDQVLVFSFPGSPSPPLGLWLKLILSMESWLKADERNVAVVHCLTGKGRTSSVLAAFLCWMGEAGFHQVPDALEYIARCKQMDPDHLTIPSQRRYIRYFQNMLDGVRPSQPPLLLKRIILSEAPKFAKGPPRTGDTTPKSPVASAPDEFDPSLMGCAPYLQIFKAGQLIFTTAATLRAHQDPEELPFCHISDGSISFHVECIVQGDVLIRCRHLTAHGQRVSMFRAAFHTGYIPPKVMRVAKQQLDGACSDDRFGDDFFVDVILEPCDAEMASKHLSGKTADPTATSGGALNPTSDHSKNEAAERRARGTLSGAAAPRVGGAERRLSGGGATVTASAYDSMLHRDSRFWDVIATRRQEHVAVTSQEQDNGSSDPMWGPTIGRRRDLSDANGKQRRHTPQEPEASNDGGIRSGRPVEAQFSIGGEFDFFDAAEAKSKQDATAPSTPVSPPKRDELMEALNALDDDALSPEAAPRPTVTSPPQVEEIVFEETTDGAESKPALMPSPVLTANDATEVDAKDETTENQTVAPAEEPTIAIDTVETAKDNSVILVDEEEELLGDDDLLDGDVSALLEATADDEDEINLDDFDIDDDDITDLENFLAQA